MPELQRPQFIDRASAELEELTKQARSGARDAEEVMAEYWDNLQKLVDDLVNWFSDEVERVGRQAEDQRKRLESRIQGVLSAASAPVKSVAKRATGRPGKKSSAASATPKKATKKSPAKKGTAKKSTAKKSAAKKSPAKNSAAKIGAAKKSPAKKSPAKKSPAKKSAAKKGAAKKSPAKVPAASPANSPAPQQG